MDIVTHALMGIAGASALMTSQPEVAFGFVFGSVAPDLDAFSRLFGKRAFLRWHQTYSHSLVVIAMLTILSVGVLSFTGSAPPEIALGFGLGMAFHSLLDLSNTYGIKLFAPISKRRISLEWVFFIDAIVSVVAAAAVIGVILNVVSGGFETAVWIGCCFWCFVVAYWSLKWLLRWRSGKLAPEGTASLVPTSFVPWQFFATRRVASCKEVELFKFDAITGAVSHSERVAVQDSQTFPQLASALEFQTMRELSSEYHLVAVKAGDSGSVLLGCRDLRTRNFNTSFGNLEIEIDKEGEVARRDWKV